MAKGICASTPHHTTSRVAAPMDMVHIDTRGPFQGSLGGSQYIVMFVDSTLRLQRPHGVRDKSAFVIIRVVNRFVADMGVLRAFRTDTGAEYTNSTFVDCCNGLGTRRELTAPCTPQQNGPVESGLSRAIKAGHAARLEVNKLFQDIHLERLKGVRDPDDSSLWIESVLWASEGFNRSTTTANSGMLFPHKIFYVNHPPIPVLPFCKPAYHRVPWRRKMAPQARPCFLLNFGYNHGSDCFKIMDAEKGMVVFSRNVTWHQPRETLIFRPRQSDRGCPIYHPVPKCRVTCISSRHLSLLPRPPPPLRPLQLPLYWCLHQFPPSSPPPLNPSALIPDRVVRALGHEADVYMSGRTRGKTRTMRDSHHSMGLMPHA